MFLRIQKWADALAKWSMICLPILFVGYAIGVVCQPVFQNIMPALVIGAVVLVLLLTLLLIPSWILDHIAPPENPNG